ncbi:MAG: extracellular solute-binding protein [Lachnospiraceae bacterium]|nr:extracellular solute-binding protein [Lachnospiraceae bacterium]
MRKFIASVLLITTVIATLNYGPSMYSEAASISEVAEKSGVLTEESKKSGEEIVLKVCNWEEYIDEGGWDDDETIDLESGDIRGDNSLVEDFEEWYFENYGKKVRVEYSCFGTNEELYSMLTIGDEYDLVCPSDYMIMKLMSEGMLEPFDNSFFDESLENNYYVKGVSPFIRDVFEENEIGGEKWSKYAAGYMWGVTGIIYNPEYVDREAASTWKIYTDEDVYRRITIKDNVRDAMFAAMGAVKSDYLLSDEFIQSPDYSERLMEQMNDVSDETLKKVQDYLQNAKNNLYSFETDSGKSDMITGKVIANYQWSGDAVYAMDQAEEDDFILEFAVPEEVTNLWFDGWVMLKNGVEDNPGKKHAAQEFVNFLSKPENVVRNMYYIGYSSVISGGEDDNTVYDYIKWTYEADPEEEEETVEYPLGFYFSGDVGDEDYIITTSLDQTKRQLYAQYPPSDVLKRSAVMLYFDSGTNAKVNRMWINVRCFNAKNIPVPVVIILLALLGCGIFIIIRSRIKNKM